MMIHSSGSNPIVVIDFGNSTLKILSETDRGLTLEAKPSKGINGAQTWESSKLENLSAIAKTYPGCRIIGLSATGATAKGVVTKRETVTVLEQRHFFPCLNNAEYLIDLGGGTTLVAGLNYENLAVNLPHTRSEQGILNCLTKIVQHQDFANCCDRPGGLAALTPTQLGVALAMLGDKTQMQNGCLVAGSTVIKRWEKFWAPKLYKLIEGQLTATIEAITLLSQRTDHAIEFDASKAYLIGGGAALLDHLAPYAKDGDKLGIQRYRPGVQAQYLNCYAAYKSAGGVLLWPE